MATSVKSILGQQLGGQYNVISTVTGDTQEIDINDASEVLTIEGLSVTANGTYPAPTGHVYNNVEVDVAPVPTQTKTETITANGTTVINPDTGYNLSQVTVITDVPNPSTGDLPITANGTYDVTTYASTTVNVPNPSTGSIDITANGTYDVTEKASAVVNVPNPSTGNIDITTTAQYDVTNYATAQINDSNLIAANIAKDVTVLGITGTHQGGITPTGTINITTNGTHDVTTYASAEVNVPAPAILLQDKTITTNGSYTADTGYDGLGTVTVNVGGGGTIPDYFGFDYNNHMFAISSNIGSYSYTSITASCSYGNSTGNTNIYFLDTSTLVGDNVLNKLKSISDSFSMDRWAFGTGPLAKNLTSPFTLSEILSKMTGYSNFTSMSYNSSTTLYYPRMAAFDKNGIVTDIIDVSTISSYSATEVRRFMAIGVPTVKTTTSPRGLTLTFAR